MIMPKWSLLEYAAYCTQAYLLAFWFYATMVWWCDLGPKYDMVEELQVFAGWMEYSMVLVGVIESSMTTLNGLVMAWVEIWRKHA